MCGRCSSEAPQGVGRHERAVDRKEDADVVPGRTQPRDDAGDRRTDVGRVVDERKGEREPVGCLAEREPLVAGLAERAPRFFRERLAVEPSERLGRAEARARSAQKQHAGQAEMRHASV